MFAKLLKHEFRSQQKLLTILSLAALGAGLVGGVMTWLLIHTIENATDETAGMVGGVLSTLVLLGIALAVAAYVIAVWILLLYRFYKHHFSQEGYLTFTLPVTTHQLLLSSMANIAIWVLISGAVCLAAVCMIFAPVFHKALSSGGELSYVTQVFREAFSVFTSGQVVLQVLSSIVSGIYALVLPLVCIAIGALLTKKYRLLTSFAIYYGVNMAMSVFSGIFSVVITMAGISSGDEGEGLLTLSLLAPMLLQLGLSIGGYFLMHRTADKKLNLP